MSNFLKLLNPLKTDKSNQHCNICNANFTISLKSHECSECYTLVCEEHANKSPTDQPVCDDCLKGRIKKELNIEFTYQLSSLKKELSELKGYKSEKRKTITSMDIQINSLQDKLRNEEKSHQHRIEDIDRQTKEEEEKVNKFQQEQKEVVSQAQTSQEKTKSLCENLARLNESIQSRKLERSGLDGEVNELKEKSEGLLEKNQELITYGRVRTMSCSKCHKVIKHKFKNEIIDILKFEGHEEMIASLIDEEIKDPDKERSPVDLTKNVCACLIF